MNTDSFNSEIPDDLREFSQAMDALGAAQRAAMPAGFEARIYAASASALTPSLKLASADEPPGRPAVVIIPMRRWLSPLRIAAAVAFLSTVGVAYLAVNGRPPAAPVVAVAAASSSEDIEHWLTVATSDDAVAAELDLLIADTERVREGIHTAPASDGGAM